MATYPTGADLQAFLASRGVECNHELTADDWSEAVEVAVSEFETDTDRIPFLCTAEAAEVRTVDGPGGYILVPGFDIISLESLEVSGSVKTEDSDFWLDYKRRDGPYQGIKFAGFVGCGRRIIELTGFFGYCLDLPARARVAILSKAAHALYPQLVGLEGDVVREEQGPVEFEYAKTGDLKYSGRRGAFLQTYDSAVQHYRRRQA